MAEQFTGNPVQVSATWALLRGHGYGLRGPVMLGAIRWPLNLRWKSDALARVLVEEAGLKEAEVQCCLAAGLDIPAFLALVLALETAAYTAVTQTGVSLGQASKDREWTEHRLAFPVHRAHFTRSVITWLASATNMVQVPRPAQQMQAAAKQLHALLSEARKQLREQEKVAGINTARLARACRELDLPMQMLPRGVLHIGSGRNGRLFMSTLTEATPALSATIARSKSLTAAMLSAQGLPVPRHKVVSSADEAVAAAREFGYPVVVKPDDGDGGQGVYAGLTTDDQVRQCFGRTAQITRKVLLETHVAGNDVRITVDNGKVVKAIGRRPGGVTGDGRGSVEQLVATAAAGRSGQGDSSILELDEEAHELLAELGMSLQSVPPAGEFIALRRRANMSTGGTSSDVLAGMHPDNARLAVRAAQALRLDLAGIDLIIPDISVSWMDSVAAICEVNAQPQISTGFAPSVYRDLLTRMVQEPVRMHAVLVLDVSNGMLADAAVSAAARELSERGEKVLMVRGDGRWLGDERIAPPASESFVAALGAELETEATAAVVAMTPEQVTRLGVPWLHIDNVRIAGKVTAVDAVGFQAALALIAPHVPGGLTIDPA